jgi:hypothetical protein
LGLGHFTRISISVTAPVVFVFDLKNCHVQSFLLEVPTGILNHFWMQVTVSEVKWPSRGRFISKTAVEQPFRKWSGYHAV